MQLGGIIALATLCFIAFSIGLNLGLHGVLSRHLQQSAPSKKPPLIEKSSDTDATSHERSVSVGETKTTKGASAPEVSHQSSASKQQASVAPDAPLASAPKKSPSVPLSTPPLVSAAPSPKSQSQSQGQVIAGTTQWSKARVLVERALEGGAYRDAEAAARSLLAAKGGGAT